MEDIKIMGLQSEIRAWKGSKFASVHGSFHIVGQIKTQVAMDNGSIYIRWIVVSEEIMPIIGIDALSFYKSQFEWEEHKVSFTRPWDMKTIHGSMESVRKIRTLEKVSIPSFHEMFIRSRLSGINK